MAKDKKKTRTVIVCAALFCFLYIIFALRPLSTELHLSPEWTEDIADVQAVGDDDELIPFRLGQNIGFFTPDGRIASHIPYAAKATISDAYYATYGTSNRQTTFYDNHGHAQGVIDEYGFPFFDGDRLYVFLPGGTSFVQCGTDGKRLWQYGSFSPVTAFSSSAGGTVAGFADGTLVSFSADGRLDQKFEPLGSEIPVILGAGISSDGQTVACVSGRKSQRFVIAEKNGEHSRIVFHEYLPKDFSSQVLVRFNRSDDTVFYNYNGGIGIVDCKRLKSSHVPLEGTVIQIEESETNGLVFILSHGGDSYTVTVIEPFDHPAGSFTFTASCAFIQVRGDAVFIGADNKISRLSISRR